MTKKGLISIVERDHVVSLLDHNKRSDARAFDEFRKITVIPGYIQKAEGSAIVKLGQTKVIVGVKAQLGEPYPDTPNSGVVTTSVELIPIASPIFESGPPRERAIELARVTDRPIRESGAVDLEALAVIPGKQVWILFVDIYVLDHDGNLFDACEIGALAALKNTMLPEIEIVTNDDGSEEVKYLGSTRPLKLKHVPISCTFSKIGDNLIVDPALDEELVEDARLTLAFTEDGEICSTQKGESGVFTEEEVFKCIEIAAEKTKEIRTHLDEWTDKEGNPWSETV
ncbi:MAG: exosome complex protein Rrp42 [Candidatus Heimdallarchaeota archaeon]|nr:exosome complex protein Rrp42 [Candidatus Heimdallarchaeota archaeon]